MFKFLLITLVLLGIDILALFCLLSLLIKCFQGSMIQEGVTDTVTDQVDNVREMTSGMFMIRNNVGWRCIL